MNKVKIEDIQVDLTRDTLLDPYAIGIMEERYLIEGETSPQQCFARACAAGGSNVEHANRMYQYMSQLWLMGSTPVLSNSMTKRGLPISCYLNYVDDSLGGLNEHYSENTWLTSRGGGIGSYWGKIRSDNTNTTSGSKSTGIIPFIHIVDSQMLACNQGTTRRGSAAVYLDISHPEIIEFITMRKPTGGDINRKNLNLHHGVNIPDSFMKLIKNAMNNPKADDTWDLIDPHSKQVVQQVSAKALWELLLETRVTTGEPYFHFIDTSNAKIHPAQKGLGLRINQSNLCSEIILPTNNERTAVCCLSSLNLEYYDSWKDTTIVEDLVEFLDNILDNFLELGDPKAISKALYSAMRERSIGLGTMGFHSYLQKNMIPFESALAVSKNKQMFKTIWDRAKAKSIMLGTERGAAPDIQTLTGCKLGQRNTYLIAVAPNASTSILCGNTSPSIEPFKANAYLQKTLNGTNIPVNKYLLELLEKKQVKDIPELLKVISSDAGSVQELSSDILTDWEKEVFKTAVEIDQAWVIQHAVDRQEYIDQAQSLNLFVPSNVDVKYLHWLHFNAWQRGLKTLYYLRAESIGSAEKIGTKIDITKYDECIACQ